MKEPRTTFLDVPTTGGDGTHKLALYEWGHDNPNPKGVVFCVHGLTRNGRDFDVLASELSTDYRVYSVDVAGRGKSDWHTDPTDYNYASYIADIHHVIEKLGLKNIHWVGTSMGGIIGIMLANHFPDLLKTLTINDVGCLIPAAGLKRIAEYIDSPTIFPSRAAAESELRTRFSCFGIQDENHWRILLKHSIQDMEDGTVRLTYDPNVAKNFIIPGKPIEDVNLWSFWEAVKPIPTLLIRGMESDLLTHETAIQMRDSHPNFTLLEVENTGHAPVLMDKEQTDAIRNRIKRS